MLQGRERFIVGWLIDGRQRAEKEASYAMQIRSCELLGLLRRGWRVLDDGLVCSSRCVGRQETGEEEEGIQHPTAQPCSL